MVWNVDATRGWERKIYQTVAKPIMIEVLQSINILHQLFRYRCTGKCANANCNAHKCWHVRWRLHDAREQEFQIESHFEIICALIMCRNHKIEAYYTFSVLSLSVILSQVERLSACLLMSGVKLPINDLRRCSRFHWINVFIAIDRTSAAAAANATRLNNSIYYQKLISFSFQVLDTPAAFGTSECCALTVLISVIFRSKDISSPAFQIVFTLNKENSIL